MSGGQYYSKKLVGCGSVAFCVFVLSGGFSNDSRIEKSTTNDLKPISQETIKQRREEVIPIETTVNKKTESQYDGDDPIVRARLGLPPKN
jgi:hypothetical protein